MSKNVTIRNIILETADRISKANKPYEDEFKTQISHLDIQEKTIMQGFLYTHEWNIGSARVLAMFKKCGIIFISEYVLRLHSKEIIQQVLNDLLETEHILLAELIRVSYSETCTTLKDILQECFSSVLNDLNEKPDVIPCNYLRLLKPHLTLQELTRLRHNHLELILRQQSSFSLSEAIVHQDRWRAEASKQRDTILAQLMEEVIYDGMFCFDKLYSAAVSADNISWKHYLVLLGMIVKAAPSNFATISHIKGVLKNMFQDMLGKAKFESLLLLMLTAREICASKEGILGNYSSWYKSTIAEMSYRIDKPNFILVMKMMECLVPLESSIAIVNVHLNTSISFPPLCMEHVVAFKKLCKTRLVDLESGLNHEYGIYSPNSVVTIND